MKWSKIDRRVRRAAGNMESLEARCLFSATVLSQIPAQTLAASGGSSTFNLATYFNDPAVTGTLVRLGTNAGGNIDLELFDSQKPVSTSNFLSYVNSGAYSNTIIHRSANLSTNSNSAPVQIIQGGAFDTSFNAIPTSAPIADEASANGVISNLTGTIAYARTSDPNSATDQWFINTTDNPVLDPSTGSAGYAVFGKVINGTMATVNGIAAIPRYDVSGDPVPNAGALSQLPATNYTQAQADGGTAPAAGNLVTITSASVIPKLTYSVSSDNSNVVSASINNGTLTLTPGVAGSANVTLTATDSAGSAVSSTFAVDTNNPATTAVTIGAGAAKSVTFTDADGTRATVALKGPGDATVNFSGIGITSQTNKNNTVTVSATSASISSIVTTGTGGTSTLTFITRGGTRAISVGGIATDGLKSLNGKGVTLTGDLSCPSSIGQVAIAGATGGAINLAAVGNFTATGAVSDDVTINGGGVSIGRFTAGSITGGAWAVSGAVKSITAGSVSGWSPTFSGGVSALTVKKGDLNGTISAVSLGAVRVNGSLANSTLQLTGSSNDLANLAVTGDISGSTINATGSLGTISAKALKNSEIFAGIGTLVVSQVLPNFPSDFVSNQSIASVKLKTVAGSDSFFNSDVAAQAIGKLQLGSVQTNNGGITTGVAAETINSFTATFPPKRVALAKLTSATDVSGILTAKNVEPGDFVLKLF